MGNEVKILSERDIEFAKRMGIDGPVPSDYAKRLLATVEHYKKQVEELQGNLEDIQANAQH